jgi:hypothetical protein
MLTLNVGITYLPIVIIYRETQTDGDRPTGTERRERERKKTGGKDRETDTITTTTTTKYKNTGFTHEMCIHLLDLKLNIIIFS